MTVLGELAPAGSGQIQVRRNSGLYGYERALKRVGFDPVAGADEAGRVSRPAGRGCGNPVGRQIPPDLRTQRFQAADCSATRAALCGDHAKGAGLGGGLH